MHLTFKEATSRWTQYQMIQWYVLKVHQNMDFNKRN